MHLYRVLIMGICFAGIAAMPGWATKKARKNNAKLNDDVISTMVSPEKTTRMGGFFVNRENNVYVVAGKTQGTSNRVNLTKVISHRVSDLKKMRNKLKPILAKSFGRTDIVVKAVGPNKLQVTQKN